MTYDQLRATVSIMGESLNTDLVVYYIGNCSSGQNPDMPRWYPGNYDDRSWAIEFASFRDYSNRNHFAPHNLPLGETEEWQAMEPIQLRSMIATRFEKLEKESLKAEERG